MLEMILDKYVMYVLMGGAAVCGIVSKLVVSIALKRLVKASGNMNKSTHPLMRLVRAKFEHACMISETVENVRVFVDKYLYEYRVLGVRLHSLRRLECGAAGACLVFGIAGAVLTYATKGMQESVLQMGAAGAGLGIIVFVLHLMTDENYRMDMIRNYMVDYLENICLRRYEKTYQKELKVMSPEVPVPDFGQAIEEGNPLEGQPEIEDPIRPRPGREVPSPEMPPEITPPVMPEPYEVPEAPPQIYAMKPRGEELRAREDRTVRAREYTPEKAGEELQTERAARFKKSTSGAVREEHESAGDAGDILAAAVKASETAHEKRAERRERREKPQEPPREILIRQILEEFMA